MVADAAGETGVILWANPQRGVAVIWCADHQRLAYYAAAAGSANDSPYAVGDLVAFTSRAACGLRLAEGLRLLKRGWHPQLAEALRERPSSERPLRRRPSHLRAV